MPEASLSEITMTNISTTNEPGGLTNAVLGSALTHYGAPDPTIWHAYFNDFDTFTAGDWTNTATGSVTNSIVAGDGGWLSMANSASNNDLNSLQLTAATFLITAGQQAWFKTRFKTSNATNAALVIGLIPTDVTPLSHTAGICFTKAAASTSLVCEVSNASTASTFTAATLANDTFVNVGWHYDGNGAVNVFVNNVKVGSVATTNLPTVALNLTIAEANGTAAAITTTVDYVFISTERPSTNL
jgi:hypothetical protein